jgi:hypothetical protein
MMTDGHRVPGSLVAGLLLLLPVSPASAQLDPLLFLKDVKPYVLVGLDLSSAMQRDMDGRYYDPLPYAVKGQPYEATLDLEGRAERRYRRRYTNLRWLEPGGTPRASAGALEVVGDLEAGFSAFDRDTRLGQVRSALSQVVRRNGRSTLFGLVTTRQDSPHVPLPAPLLQVEAATQYAPTDGPVSGRWQASFPVVLSPASGGAARPRVIPADAGGNAQLLSLLARGPAEAEALIPAGFDDEDDERPLATLVDDLRTEAARLMAADAACRNVVAVLILAGGQATFSPEALIAEAEAFLKVAGRRVPLHVIALAPRAAEAGQLSALARRGGGRYVEVRADGCTETGDVACPELQAALNDVVQHAFADGADLAAAPIPMPDGPLAPPVTRFSTGQPVVGTVDLSGARDASGQLLPNSRVLAPDGSVIRQSANVVLTAGFGLPGFRGLLEATRIYKPVSDPDRPSGYRFTSDGTRLWTARVPLPDRRNVFTVLPGRGLVAFSVANAGLLAPYLRATDSGRVITEVLSRPLGPMVNSTPALLTAPALLHADSEYVAFVNRHHRRRALVFAGAADGMLHALDARTGLEVWAVIPFNLLPTLARRGAGQAVDDMTWGVDASCRLADVRTTAGWRTLLVVGEGPGGTFYQAFDVTLDGIEEAVAPDEEDPGALLSWLAAPERIPFRWSFPRYEHFDATVGPTGDIAASATDLEKTVGHTWATPAIETVGDESPRSVVLVGSGPMPASRQGQPQRGGTTAGTRFYMLDAETGEPLDNRDVGSDGLGETADACGEGECAHLKNALQADAVAAGPPGAASVDRVYAGDLDGRLWRFDVGAGAAGSPTFRGPPHRLFDGGPQSPLFTGVGLARAGADSLVLAFGTGSALLPGAFATRLVGLHESGGVTTVAFDLPGGTAPDGGHDRLLGSPAVAGEIIFFTTRAVTAGTACRMPSIALFALTLTGGAAYGVGGDRRQGSRPPPVTARLPGRHATTPVAADRHLYLSRGGRLDLFGDREGFNAAPGVRGLRVLSLREVRRAP